jgi:hypothetical protein
MHTAKDDNEFFVGIVYRYFLIDWHNLPEP